MAKSQNGPANDDALESRLLNRHHAAKRIKLVKEHAHPKTGDAVCPADYLAQVKELLRGAGSSLDKENTKGRQAFIDFQVRRG